MNKLNIHINNFPEDDDDFYCETLEKNFINLKFLKHCKKRMDTLYLKNGYLIKKCKICNLVKYPCFDCGKILSSNRRLNNHALKHFNKLENKNNKKICNICGKKIDSIEVYLIHLVNHIKCLNKKNFNYEEDNNISFLKN